MTLPVAVPSALGSALAAASSSVLQHRSAREVDAETTGRWRLLWRLLSRPDWLAGFALAGVGLALHTLALVGGRLAVVQPLLVSGLLFALPVSVLLEGRRPSLVEWGWALALVAGLGTFLVTSHPSGGRVPVDADVLLWTTVAGLALVAVGAAAGLGPMRRHAAGLLGSAAGIAYGLTAALLKQTTAIAAAGAAAVLTDWPLWALIAVGAAAIGLTQLAYRSGPLAGSLPALTIGDPVVSVLIGALAFHERLAGGPGPMLLEVMAFALMALAAVQLARRADRRAEA